MVDHWFKVCYYCKFVVHVLTALNTLYPNYNLIQSKPRQQRGYWKSEINQRHFLEQLEKELNIQKPEDWYKVGIKTVTATGKGGSFIDTYYNGSLIRGKSLFYLCGSCFNSIEYSVPKLQFDTT